MKYVKLYSKAQHKVCESSAIVLGLLITGYHTDIEYLPILRAMVYYNRKEQSLEIEQIFIITDECSLKLLVVAIVVAIPLAVAEGLHCQQHCY